MNGLVEVIKDELNKLKKMLTQTGSDYTATVTKVEGDTAYVQIAGSDISDTPVSMTINANVGDKVRVRVSNGRAWITGNDTAPPADNKQVLELIENNSQGLIETEAKYSRIDQTIDQITIEVGEVDTKADNAQATADGRMKSDMSNKASSITVNSGQIAFNSNSLVVNSSKFTLDQNGNATFGGSLSAAGGSFTGHIVCTHRNDWNINICDPNYTYPLYIRYRDYENMYSWFSGLTAGFKSGTNEAYMNATGVHTSSDRRLKEDITELGPEAAKQLIPVRFRYKGDDKLHYGFIAQDVQKIMPDAVQESEDGYLTLTYHELIAPLYALVQEQEDRINQLEIRLKALEEKK